VEQASTAARLGYGVGPEAIAAMNREHDDLHLRLCAILGTESRSLRFVAYGEEAHPTRACDAIGFEEALILGVQEWLNTGNFNEDIRYLWWFGLEPDELRRELRP
jgi:hypothetical protein